MMREILFRGKRIDNGNWVNGFYLSSADFESQGISVITVDRPRIPHYVSTETIGQFTGLTDKNGKKIFEGDIVRFDNRLSVVEYVDCRMGFAFRKTIGHGIVPGFTMPHWETCEIIGNIHDNPELLEVTNDA